MSEILLNSGMSVGEIILGILCVALILVLALVALKKLGIVPKWFKFSAEKKNAMSHLGCPLVPDIPVIIEETKNYTSRYMLKYVINRINAPYNYAKRRMNYLRNILLSEYSKRLFEVDIKKHDKDMGIIRIVSSYLFSFIEEEIKEALIWNSFPENDNDWKEYKKTQTDFIISEACRRVENTYPSAVSISLQELSKLLRSMNFTVLLTDELNNIFDFAKRDLIKLEIKEKRENEAFSDRIFKILEGSLRINVFGGSNVPKK